jgi:hypothetical protein
MHTRDQGANTAAKLPHLLRMFFYDFDVLSWERTVTLAQAGS